MILSLGGASYDLTVSGIYNAGYDDLFVGSDIEEKLYEGLPQQENYSISYDVASFEDVVAVSNKLKLSGIASKNTAAEVFAMQESFRSLDRLFRVISALVLALALFLCAVLLFKLQNSRYRELGLLAALGFRASYLRGMVRWENLYLSVFSAAVSGALLMLAALICRAVGFPLSVGAAQIAICLGGAFAVIISVSSLASARLIRTEPAAALKHS